MERNGKQQNTEQEEKGWSKTNAECQKVTNDKKSSWEEGFIKYFERHVETKLEYFCLWSINNKCAFDENNGITTNQSEGFNFLLKDFQNRKEVPLDCLMMSLKLIQGFYSEECRRGKAGLGNFSLKPKYVKFRTPTENFESRHLVCHPKDIVNSIKNTEFVRSSDEKNIKTHEIEHSSNTRVLRAKQLVEQDHISFSPKLGVFTIMDTKSLYTVRLFPTESCTCPLRKSCIHILSVKLGMRMTLKQNDFEHQNIGVVRKNERTTSLKPGRKRPRPGDISPEKSVENIVKNGKLVEAEQPLMEKKEMQ